MTLTRRDFSKAAAAGAFLSAPMLGAQEGGNNGRRLGYCIVGLGRISMGHFMPACKLSEHSRVVAFVSGHPDKADKMAHEYNVPRQNIFSYDNYDEIAQNP